MTVQFTIAGNFLALVRKASPTGEKASTTCRFFLQRRSRGHMHVCGGGGGEEGGGGGWVE